MSSSGPHAPTHENDIFFPQVTIPGDNYEKRKYIIHDCLIGSDNIGNVKNKLADSTVSRHNYCVLENYEGNNIVGRINYYLMKNKIGANICKENQGIMENISGLNQAEKNLGIMKSVNGQTIISGMGITIHVVGETHESSISRIKKTLSTLLCPSLTTLGGNKKTIHIKTPDFTCQIPPTDILHVLDTTKKDLAKRAIDSNDTESYFALDNGYTLTHKINQKKQHERLLRYKDQLITINQKGYSVEYIGNAESATEEGTTSSN